MDKGKPLPLKTHQQWYRKITKLITDAYTGEPRNIKELTGASLSARWNEVIETDAAGNYTQDITFI